MTFKTRNDKLGKNLKEEFELKQAVDYRGSHWSLTRSRVVSRGKQVKSRYTVPSRPVA